MIETSKIVRMFKTSPNTNISYCNTFDVVMLFVCSGNTFFLIIDMVLNYYGYFV